jgi:LysR family transcriptional regulator, cell division regulator
MIPSPTEIEHFIEIYHTRHISKAAMKLGITQPTLTQSLKRLEEKLQTPLFHRTKQGVIPTSHASLFYSRAKTLHECWHEIQSGIHSSQNEIEGTFVVGCHQSVAAYTLPTLLNHLAQEAPKLNIQLVHDFSRKITERVVSYEMDIGYVVNPPRHPDLVLKKIGNDKVMFWKKKGTHAIPKRIFADRSRAQSDDLLGKTLHSHFRGWSVISTSSLELIRTMVNRGLGIGILPERVARADDTDLVIYDKQLPTRPDEIYLAYRREVLSSKAGRELLRLATFQL